MLSASLKAEKQIEKKHVTDHFEFSCDPLWEEPQDSQLTKSELKPEAVIPGQKAQGNDLSSFNQLVASYHESSKEPQLSQSLKNSPLRFFMYKEQQQEQRRTTFRGRSQSDITPNTTSMPIPIKTKNFF